MFKDRIRGVLRIIRTIDVFVVGLVFVVALTLRPVEGFFRFSYKETILLISVISVWVAMLNLFKVYTIFWMQKRFSILANMVKATVLGIVLMGGFVFILKVDNVSRNFTIFTFIGIGIVLCFEKILIAYFMKNMCWKDYSTKNILIVGTSERAKKLIDLVEASNEWGMKVIGIVDRDRKKVGMKIGNYSVIGDFESLDEVIHNNVIDEVIFVVPRGWLNRIEELIRLCELEGVTVHIAVDYFEPKGSRLSQTDLHGFPLLTIESTRHRFWQTAIKRITDFTISLLALFLLSPVFVGVAIAIKLSSPGPIFFKQDRIGLNGRKFVLWKFRTMVKDAESKRGELLDLNEMKGPVFKITDDPRVTKVGKFLRVTSLDELPQLIVVLKGDMSLVGPRPLPIEENQYEVWQRRRLSVKPGITCIWQISGRNKITDFSEWVKMDLKYIDTWTLRKDCMIMLRTIPAVIFGKGAK
ncbi:MAG: sugar transferase [Candidatus Omnitrophica bacterium]|nr:sugar transferase [Candidatus Omnitrophota bacterium]